jgi:hypothetical protein
MFESSCASGGSVDLQAAMTITTPTVRLSAAKSIRMGRWPGKFGISLRPPSE